MFRARQLLVATLVANLLLAGFVGAVHVHEHDGCGDCVPALDVQCANRTETGTSHRCACGHDHGTTGSETTLSETKSSRPERGSQPHDHDSCSVCQFLATAWLPTPDVDLEEAAGLVELRPVESTGTPFVDSTSQILPRGPPAA